MFNQHEWLKGYNSRNSSPEFHAQNASYSLMTLAEKGMLKRDEVSGMLLDTGLRDFTWHITWAEDYDTTDDELEARIGEAEGYVVFIHGWTGSNVIWEDLPARIVARNRKLVALVVDHNGFGQTPFIHPTPDIVHCNPIGAMRAVESWFELLKLRRQPGERQLKTVNFVGHSMGGAALFFLDETKWRLGEQTRTALAPALLLHDEMHRTFYTTLGLGIGLVGRLRFLEIVDDIVSPAVIDILADGATERVKAEHTRIYAETPKSVTARTFAAMGVIDQHPEPRQWEFMRVVLGHKDRLVGLIPALNLMEELNLDVDQIRVVLGTHYLFSVGDEMARVHEQNRALIMHDILHLHTRALQKQKEG